MKIRTVQDSAESRDCRLPCFQVPEQMTGIHTCCDTLSPLMNHGEENFLSVLIDHRYIVEVDYPYPIRISSLRRLPVRTQLGGEISSQLALEDPLLFRWTLFNRDSEHGILTIARTSSQPISDEWLKSVSGLDIGNRYATDRLFDLSAFMVRKRHAFDQREHC